MSGVFNIGIDRRFVDELARGILTEHREDPLALADMLILLPTRRSVRTLREAFLRASDGRPTLLPRLAPLGDIYDGDFDESVADAMGEASAFALPPAIDPAEREALLAQLVAAFKDDQGQPIAQSAAQALKLARELAHLLDELAIDGIAFDRLESLVQGNFAHHWQRTLQFLAIVGEHWPRLLAERGQIDQLERRTRSIRAQAALWRDKPPTTPIIAAGSTGTQPATRELLRVIAGLPHGAVVLPGLDKEMDETSWQKLDPTHPQFALRDFLQALGCARSDVVDWPGESGDPARRLLIGELMRPAETSEAWRKPKPASLDHVTRVDCATPHQEALVIALAMREILADAKGGGQRQTAGLTAALVTPDRDLARRVAADLRRWDIEIDDSAGDRLFATPPATLLRALLAAVASQFAPVDLLALLNHPLSSLGLERAALLDAARRLDRNCLRGLKPSPGLAALHGVVAQAKFGAAPDRAIVIDLIDRLAAATAGLVALERASPALLLDATVVAAERICPPDILWSGDAGEALSEALSKLRAGWRDKPEIDIGEWPALLSVMLSTEIVRLAYRRHPRLAIWGPLEARLQRADLLILGGLNEGTWPPTVETGPWINRPMRTALGLPQPERRIGQSAHDFAAGLGAERVLLTRAQREGGAPTVPSRWLARLDALFGYEPAKAPPEYIQRGRRTYLAWAEALDRPDSYAPWPRPEPRPPAQARPTQLSVSDIEQWRRDPYGLYARRILKLKVLDPLEQELGAADRGSALHEALHEFLDAHRSGILPPDALQRFERLGERHLSALLTAPAERAFWWPRFERLARWLVATENGRRAGGARVLDTETDGTMALGGLTVTARADRVDDRGGGTWDIIDYKTGRVPTRKELKALFAPQLLLEAAMAERGGFARIKGKPKAVAMSYWQANGLGEGGKVVDMPEADELVPAMLALLAKMVDHFASPLNPYGALPWPEFSPHFNDYAHLERIAEWSTAGDGDEE